MGSKSKVLFGDSLAGFLEKYDNGYRFTYDSIYLNSEKAKAISLSLPLSAYPFQSKILFSFFDGLIPEGWLLKIAKEEWHIKGTDRFELLNSLCRDTIGAVTVVPVEEDDHE